MTLLSLENRAAYYAIPAGTKQTWATFTVGGATFVAEWDTAAANPNAAADAKVLDKMVSSIKIRPISQ